MKSILVYANEDGGFGARLQTALDLARAFGAHLTFLQVTPYDSFIMGDPFGGIYALPIVVEEIRKAEEAHRNRIEEKLRRESVPWSWENYEGSPAHVVLERASLADLIVVSLTPPGDERSDAPLSLAADVAVHARSAVLAVPPEQKGFDCAGHAAVAWNGSPEGAHALRLALPLLEKASAVHVVTVSDDARGYPPTEACHYLARHGIGAQLHSWPLDGGSTADAIRAAAATLGAAYVVMGCYGHSRLREAVLGGVTREMLRESGLPLLIAH